MNLSSILSLAILSLLSLSYQDDSINTKKTTLDPLHSPRSPRNLSVTDYQPIQSQQRVLVAGSCLVHTERTFIDGSGHICCNGTQFRVTDPQFSDCCSDHFFDLRTHVCCEGVIRKARGTSNRLGKCCGNVTFYPNCYKCRKPENILDSRFDERKELCCADRILEMVGNLGCCGDFVYNKNDSFCNETTGSLHTAKLDIFSQDPATGMEVSGNFEEVNDTTDGVNLASASAHQNVPTNESDLRSNGTIIFVVFIILGAICGMILIIAVIFAISKWKHKISYTKLPKDTDKTDISTDLSRPNHKQISNKPESQVIGEVESVKKGRLQNETSPVPRDCREVQCPVIAEHSVEIYSPGNLIEDCTHSRSITEDVTCKISLGDQSSELEYISLFSDIEMDGIQMEKSTDPMVSSKVQTPAMEFTLNVNCDNFLEHFKKSTNICDKNVTSSLFSTSGTQTDPKKGVHKRNIFCRDWDFHGQFNERGGTLKKNKESSVHLTIQPDSLKEGTYVDVYGSIYTQTPDLRRKFGLTDDQEFASVAVEYMIPGNPKLLKYAVVKMKYVGKKDDLEVWWFKSDEGSSDRTEIKLVEPRSKENSENQEMFYEVGVDGFVYVYTKHFSGFFCKHCEKHTATLYPYIFGSYKLLTNGRCKVAMRMHLMTSDIYQIPEYLTSLEDIELRSSSQRKFLEYQEIVLEDTDDPAPELRFTVDIENENNNEDDYSNKQQWKFKHGSTSEKVFRIGDVVRCHTESNARVDWFLESMIDPTRSDPELFECCVKINEGQVENAACGFNTIPVSMEPEISNKTMTKLPICNGIGARSMHSSLPSVSNLPMAQNRPAHPEISSAVTFKPGFPMAPEDMDTNVRGPPADIAVNTFPVQEEGGSRTIRT